jgi:hypothetical protein
MKRRITVDHVADSKNLLSLGHEWNRLCEETPGFFKPLGGTWDRTFPWMLGWLSEVPEPQRDLLVLTARAGKKLIGILPAIMQEGQEGREISFLGSEGCFGDCKGILATGDDQIRVGAAFGEYLAKEWIGRLGRILFHGVSNSDVGIQSLIESLVLQSPWIAHRQACLASRYVFRVNLGPDAEPIWPLATRRTIGTVRKAYDSGLFEYTEAYDDDDDRQSVVKRVFAIRGMLKNDAKELKQRFGSIPMAQRILDYRFAPGTADCLSKVGRLGVSNLYWKENPIAGAMFVDFGNARNVFWMEARVHPEQEQLIVWMLLTQLLRSALRNGNGELQLSSPLGARMTGMKNYAPAVSSILATPRSSVDYPSGDSKITADLSST